MKIARQVLMASAAIAAAIVGSAFADAGDALSLAGRWRFALGDTANCTDTIALPTTTDIAKKGDGRIGGVEVEKIDPIRDDAAVQNRRVKSSCVTREFGI